MKRIHLIVSGRVQGVAFRANTQSEALKLGLTGWVKNLADGSVEIVAEGESKPLDAFASWCKCGPSAARVEQMRKEEADASGEFGNFSIRYS